MFKIDKSSVEYIDSNKSAVVIKYWSAEGNRFDEEEEPEPPPAAETIEKKNVADTVKEEKQPISPPIEEESPNKIIEQAYMEAEQIKAAAWNEGYNHGQNEAKIELEAYIKQQNDNFEKLITEVKLFQDSIIAELEESALQLSFDMAEKIVNIQLEKDDILFVGIVKKAIERLNAKEKFTLKLNQVQFDKYFQNGSDWLMEEAQCAPFTALKDPGVAPYGCIVESEEGIVDAGVENQFKLLQRTFGKEESQYNEAL